MATVFDGTEGVNTFILIALKNAIKLYVQTGMKANRSYTPKNMLAKASEFTGKIYKRGQLAEAQKDLEELYEQILEARRG